MLKNLDSENFANILAIIGFIKFNRHLSFPPYGIVYCRGVGHDAMMMCKTDKIST